MRRFTIWAVLCMPVLPRLFRWRNKRNREVVFQCLFLENRSPGNPGSIFVQNADGLLKQSCPVLFCPSDRFHRPVRSAAAGKPFLIRLSGTDLFRLLFTEPLRLRFPLFPCAGAYVSLSTGVISISNSSAAFSEICGIECPGETVDRGQRRSLR